jgi:hypothetical protein
MRGSRYLLLPAITAVALGLALPAEAQPPDKSKAVSSGTTIYVIAVPARAGEICKGRRTERWSKNALGGKVLSFYQEVHWCWNRHKITRATRRAWGEERGLGWDFKGVTRRERDVGRRRRWIRFFAQGKFKLCGGGFCIQNKSPFIFQTIFRGGGYRVRTGGT